MIIGVTSSKAFVIFFFSEDIGRHSLRMLKRIYQNTRYHVPQDRNIHIDLLENLKSHNFMPFYSNISCSSLNVKCCGVSEQVPFMKHEINTEQASELCLLWRGSYWVQVMKYSELCNSEEGSTLTVALVSNHWKLRITFEHITVLRTRWTTKLHSLDF